MDAMPEILGQTPRNFEEVFDAVRVLGQEPVGNLKPMNALLRPELELREPPAAELRPNIECLFEWVDLIYCAGHWIPQMPAWAGVEDGIPPQARI